MNYVNKLKRAYKEADKKSFAVYFILRILVIMTLIRQLLLHNYENVFVCILSLFLFLLPFFIEKKFKISIPSTVEIIILLFIFSAEILGEINNFYIRIVHFDTILHTINGFICAGIGFSLINLLNENSKKIKLSPIYLSLVAFSFSMTIGVLWEFFEYGADQLLGYDMQKDTIIDYINTVEFDESKSNVVVKIDGITKTIVYDKDNVVIEKIDGYLDIGLIDTMKDLIVNFIGALVFSVFGYFNIKNRNKYKFVDKFIWTKEMNIVKDGE